MPQTTSRRQFITQTGAALGGVVFAGCQSTQSNSSSDSSFNETIIDTHTHFYDPVRPQGVPWPRKNDAVLYRKVMPADYQALPKPQPVTGTVVVEASAWIEDNQWILDLAKEERFIVGFVGNLPVQDPKFSDYLDRFTKHPLFRGVRLRKGDLLKAKEDKAVLANIRRIAERGLSLDVVGNPSLIPAARQLALAVPELKIVIDHLAGVRIDGGEPPADWKQSMESLATCPNVNCKISGLVEGSGKRNQSAPTDTAFYEPILNSMWNMFGAERLVYGSNWPVCEHFATLETVQRIVMDYFQSHGKQTTEKVFSKNARSVYGWIER